MTPIAALARLVGFGLLATAVGAGVRSAAPGGSLGWDAFRALCAQWAQLWGLPAAILMTVGIIESSLHPGMTEITDPRAASRGGSWGLFGMTQKTAAGLLAEHPPLAAQPAAKAWNGSGASLHDPTLAAMLASFHLATLWHKYGSFLPTVAAYQQGTGPVDAVLARGGNLATDLPPHGREYVARAQKAYAELSSRGDA